MTVTFYPSELRGHACLPGSKSDIHRRLICAAMSPEESVIRSCRMSEDTAVMLRALTVLGASAVTDSTGLRVRGPSVFRRVPELYCGESASVLRFLLPVCLAKCGGADLITAGRLAGRPLDGYTGCLPDIRIMRCGDRISVRGSLTAGRYDVDASVSGQFVSGLLMALSAVPGTSVLSTGDTPVSVGYVRMTEQALADAGNPPRRTSSRAWRITGEQGFRAFDVTAEPDFSAAAVVKCLNAVGHRVSVDLPEHTYQPDSMIDDLLASSGPYDISACPDLAPVLAVTLGLRPGRHIITGCGRLRFKESDRLHGIVRMLNDLGGHACTDGSSVTVDGVDVYRGGVTLDCASDHRMIMAAAAASTRCGEPVTVPDAGRVSRSWPDFIEVWRSLGGKLS